jgi:hypothetical protein
MAPNNPSGPTIPHSSSAPAWRNVNDRSVDEISLEIFYRPHTITLLV